MKKSISFLFIILITSVSCKHKNKDFDCFNINEINEITLNYRHSMYSINGVHKSLITLTKRDSLTFDFTEMGYGFTDNGNDTLTKEIFKTISLKKVLPIRKLINKIDEKISSEQKVIGFDGSSYKLTYGDGLNYKHFDFWSPRRREELKTFNVVVEKILELSSDLEKK